MRVCAAIPDLFPACNVVVFIHAKRLLCRPEIKETGAKTHPFTQNFHPQFLTISRHACIFIPVLCVSE